MLQPPHRAVCSGCKKRNDAHWMNPSARRLVGLDRVVTLFHTDM